jgi:hypothetical protein
MAYQTYIRPRVLTIFCIVGFVGRLIFLPSMFSPEVRKMGDFYPALFGLFNALTFVAFVGIWHMKRWGVAMYMYVFLIQLIVGVMVDHVSIVRLVTVPIFLIPFLIYYKRMDPNL